ncbi:MAG: prepilin-type N-terminal cleavage/methylation domain-containing protein [Methylobacter sp.]|nr:prepilin-type N-terminal cleavage/methylation domain-containing protein [Methylobacter sp.]
MNSSRQRGFTLIELLMFIVIITIGLLGILSVMDLTVQHSADPMVRKQAAALADSVMEEILLMAYVDPDGLPNVLESGRSTYDDVDDYNGLTQAAFGLPTELAGYEILITVAPAAALSGVTMKKVTVQVTSGDESISMVGYRAGYL